MGASASTSVIGVVGSGVMGRGIAQLFVQSGHDVRLFDSKPEAAAGARQFVLGMIDRQVAKGTLDVAGRDGIATRLTVADGLEGLAGCDVVIEAIVEDLAAKQALFRSLEGIVCPAAILASNTSSLTVSAIAAACTVPTRVAGLHFFNPVPLMRLIEIIPGLRTDPAVIARLSALAAATGHKGVIAADQPGFLVNHAGRGLYTEGLRLLEEGVADAAAIDRILRESCGFRMGPFELLDLTGLDVSGAVMQSIYDQFQQEPRYRPSSLVPPRIAAGLFGRKTGQGFYMYRDGAKMEAAEPVPPAASPGRLWIESGAAGEAWAARLAVAGARRVERADQADVCLVLPWGEDATCAALRMGLDPTRTVALDPLVGWGRRQVLMAPLNADPAAIGLVHGWLAGAGAAATVIGDSVGFVAQRVLAMIVNIGCEIAQRGIATEADIDAAVRLGLGYPQGPLALGDAIGPARIVAILAGLQEASGDPRYRPSHWLRRRARLGMTLLPAMVGP